MTLTIIIFCITIILMICSVLFFPTITIKNKQFQTFWMVTLLGAIAMLICGRIDTTYFLNSLVAKTSINPLKIIILFFSMTFLSCFLDEQGFFKFLAVEAINKAKSKQFSIFTIFYFLVSILTIFTSNDIIILTFTPFICYFCKHSNINPIPYLIAEFVAANTLSMALLIGNPTNIYLALSANITFTDYFNTMFIKSLIVCVITYGILLLIFNKDLKKEIVKEKEVNKLENMPCVYVGVVTLILCIIGMAISSYIHIDMYLISAIFAIFIVIFAGAYEVIIHKNKHILIHTLKRLPYALIPFLFSMFTIVSALNTSGFTSLIANTLKTNNDVLSIGLSSFITCSLTNNIPMSVLYADILSIGNYSVNAIYAAIIGSNVGAIFTPIGALAGIMFINIVNKAEVKFKYIDFIKYGMPLSIILIVLSLGLLLI